MNTYNGYFGGMNLIWWIIWMGVIFWIFLTPWSIPGERRKKDAPLDILQKRFATGEITKDQYLEHKKLLETV
ncbi:MAG: SHOCT domain-containing protein [Bacteroidota bacterium]|nr:SHOCT domain-containing protein [Bacteroidota bacterium]